MAEHGGAVRIEPLACRTPAFTTPSSSPSMRGSLSTKTSDESNLSPEEDVCLSQAHLSSQTPAQRGAGLLGNVVIPETLPETQDDLSFPVHSEENVLPGTAASEEEDDASLPTENRVPETEIDTGGCVGAEPSVLQKQTETAAEESPDGRVSTQQGTGNQLTKRQAALRNTLCPSPGKNQGTPPEIPMVSGSKRPASSRGRGAQGVLRSERGSNMKPLAQIGSQEKFRAPAVVTDAGKGRGRGGKPVKRKRDQ